MPVYKNLFIVNPNAGMKQAVNNLPKILDLFTENGDINSVHLTEKKGDGTKLAATHGHSSDRIICVGGDGTFNEVVTGIKNSGLELPIGDIPAGTANDLANSLGVSKNMIQAAKDILTGKKISIDIGSFDGNYFSYIASFGAFTKASYNTPQASKNMLGQFAYILEAIKELPAIRPEYIKIEYGQNKERAAEGEYIFGAFCNSKSMGGILTLDSGIVDMSDGLFEALLVKPLLSVQAVWDCVYSLLNRTYCENSEYITFFRADGFTVFADPSMPWTLDGEHAGGRGIIEIKNLCRAVNLIVRQ